MKRNMQDETIKRELYHLKKLFTLIISKSSTLLYFFERMKKKYEPFGHDKEKHIKQIKI
jgi:hypothetical protein